MVSTPLPGPWRGHATTDDLRREAIEPSFDDTAWLPMSVPGHWTEHDRLRSRRSVLYRTTFSLPVADRDDNSRHWIVFDGIWQSADVWLDGHYLGPTDGWFTAQEFEITDALSDGDDHQLLVEVMAPARTVDGPSRNLSGIYDDTDVVGHDNLGGIWKSVRVVSTGPVRMTKKRVVCTEATAESATLHLRCHVLSEESTAATIVTTVRPPGGGAPITLRQDHELASGSTVLEWDVRIADPELWWPWELGDQPLYRVSVSVELDGSISGIWDRTVGLRTVEMKNYVLTVNGERLFARGVDMWPTNALPADADPDRIRADIALARNLGLNLVRLESHVARPELYHAADRAGMLIWQDLPMRGEVKRTVQRTAVNSAHRLVDELGGHPSIAIWCAHYDSTGTTTGPRPATALPTRRSLFGVAKQQTPTWTKSVLDRLVGRAFRRADPSRPVVESSGTWPSAPSFDGTDTHLRFGWNSGTGRDLEVFARRIPRMVRWVSSFGAQAVPDHADVPIRNWPADLNLLADRHGLMQSAFRQYLPTDDYPDAAAWIAASQAYQATVLRRQIETLRRLKYKPTGGFTFAALADARPAISFAIHDHDRQPKQAVGAVRAACRPIIVVADRLPVELRPGDAVLLDVHVISDERSPIEGLHVHARLEWSDGSHQWAWTGAVGADDVARIGSINWIVPDAPGPVALHLRLTRAGEELSDNHYRGAITPSL